MRSVGKTLLKPDLMFADERQLHELVIVYK